MSKEFRYCHICGGPLTQNIVEGKLRPICISCGHVVFLDPKLVAVVVVTMGDGLVLIKRNTEPAICRWSFPSGYVDRGESVEDAALREVREETGLDARLNGFVGLYSETGRSVVLAAYSAYAYGGTLCPGPEASHVEVFGLDNLPPLPFPSDDDILRDWKRLEEKKSRP